MMLQDHLARGPHVLTQVVVHYKTQCALPQEIPVGDIQIMRDEHAAIAARIGKGPKNGPVAAADGIDRIKIGKGVKRPQAKIIGRSVHTTTFGNGDRSQMRKVTRQHRCKALRAILFPGEGRAGK